MAYTGKPASPPSWESWWSCFFLSILRAIYTVLVCWNFVCCLSLSTHPPVTWVFTDEAISLPTKSLAVAFLGNAFLTDRRVWLYINQTVALTLFFFYSRKNESSSFCFCKQLYVLLLTLSIYKHDAQMKYFIVNPTPPFILYFEKLMRLVPMAVTKLKEESALQVVVSFLVLFHVKRALNYCHGGQSLPAFIQNHTPIV